MSANSECCVKDFIINELESSNIIGRCTMMKKSCHIWYGTQGNECSFGSLVTAIPTKFEKMSIGTVLIDENENNQQNDLSKKLSTKYKIQVIISSSGITESSNDDSMMLVLHKKMCDVLNEYYTKP